MTGYHRIDDKKRSLLGELLIRKIVIDCHSIDNDKITFGCNKYGKPYINGLPNFHFNVSHSGDWVVCGFSQKSIGIDIEEIKYVDVAVAQYCFSEEEYSDLINLTKDKRAEYFFMLWTLKESYFKAVGKGLTNDLKSINFAKVNKDTATQQINDVFCKIYKIDPKYSLAVCGYEREFDPIINFIKILPSDFLKKIPNISKLIAYKIPK